MLQFVISPQADTHSQSVNRILKQRNMSHLGPILEKIIPVVGVMVQTAGAVNTIANVQMTAWKLKV